MNDAGADVQVRSLSAWLLGEGYRFATPGAFLEAFAERLCQAGLPLCRLTLTLSQLHPVFRAVTFQWYRGEAATEIPRRRENMTSRIFSHSPIALAMRTRAPLRRRLVGPEAELDFPVLEEFRDKGITDYYVVPLDFGGPQDGGITTYSSDRVDGFDRSHVALIDQLTPALNLVGTVHADRRSIEGLLTTYVGEEPARRILGGEVVRGVGHTVRAVVWWCDLRGFTRLSEGLARDDMLGLLNTYFAAAVDAVHEQDCEVLKFMGDAVLAIFRCEDGDDCSAAQRALAAVRDMQDALAEANRERMALGEPAIECGIALHLGPVMYGNIGAPERLDFTVIGPTVNRVSRLAQLCGPLGETVVLSADVAGAAAIAVRPLGRHVFKGLEEEQAAFAPA